MWRSNEDLGECRGKNGVKKSASFDKSPCAGAMTRSGCTKVGTDLNNFVKKNTEESQGKVLKQQGA